MKRRKFLIHTTAGIAALTVPILPSCSGEIKYNDVIAQPLSVAKIWEIEQIGTIGELYRNQFPKEATEQALAKLLTKDIPEGQEDLTEVLNQKIKEDFAKENTVILDGWILSVTEARQCALFSILQTQNN